MKAIIAAIAACTLSTAVLAADPAAPADKKDSGSLSSGAKETSPATKGQGENSTTDTGSASGASAGERGDSGASTGGANSPGPKKGEVPSTIENSEGTSPSAPVSK